MKKLLIAIAVGLFVSANVSAQIKISEMPALSTNLDGADFPTVFSAKNFRVSGSYLKQYVRVGLIDSISRKAGADSFDVFKNGVYAYSVKDYSGYIKNQYAASQAARVWANRVKADTLVAGTVATNPSTFENGQIFYNSTDGRLKAVQNGAILNLVGTNITGRTVLVDKDNVNATDTRGAISKYSQDFPWKTINAAVAAVTTGDNLLIQNGTYNEIVDNVAGFPVGTTVTIQNATVLSWKVSNNGMNMQGLGNSNVDTLYYQNPAVYSGLTKIKVIQTPSGTSNSVFRNIYTIDSISTTSGAVEFYNINSIRVVRPGANTKFYNCRIVSTTGSGIAVRPSSGSVTNVNNVSFVECYIEGSVYAFDLANLGTKFKILDSEIVGGTNAIFGGAGGTVRTAEIRIANTLLRSNPGNNTISAGHANATFNLQLSNTTRSGGTAALGTINLQMNNNDFIYSGL